MIDLGIAKQKYEESMFMFDTSMIRACLMNTMWQRIKGAWAVLSGKAGMVFFEIKPEDMYKDN